MKTDLQLVEDLKAKDVKAMGELYNRHFDKVYQKCLSITKNPSDAYDCANDSLLISFEKINGFKAKSEYTTWLYSITTNYCISFCKKNKRIVPISEFSKHSPYSSAVEYEIAPQKDLCEILEHLLDSITVYEKELLREKYSYRRSIEELQVKYGMGASAIKMRLSRAKKKVLDLYNLNLAASA